MWLTVLHLTLVHSHVLNIGEKAQPDLHQSKHRQKAQLKLHNQYIEEKAQPDLHQSEHPRESAARPAPIKISDRKPS